MMVDNNTKERNGLNFARIMDEVKMGTQLLEVVKFKNEKGRLVEQPVWYDWKPTLCKFCKKYRHEEKEMDRGEETLNSGKQKQGLKWNNNYKLNRGKGGNE
ncbi:hypothetical protein KY284_010592 [Solanum tuberosum]|nr:hypothetical protein KY284_010592 [Solanum tuberosum]